MRAVLPVLLMLATPATAQIWDGGRGQARPTPERFDSGVTRDLNDVDRSIRQGRRSGELTRREARALRGQSASIARLGEQYRNGGPIAAHAGHLQEMTLALRGVVEAKRARGR